LFNDTIQQNRTVLNDPSDQQQKPIMQGI